MVILPGWPGVLFPLAHSFMYGGIQLAEAMLHRVVSQFWSMGSFRRPGFELTCEKCSCVFALHKYVLYIHMPDKMTTDSRLCLPCFCFPHLDLYFFCACMAGFERCHEGQGDRGIGPNYQLFGDLSRRTGVSAS
ncbi:hypothetical protein BDBG_17739 [Blastomyces gilchristii SLH14081]|uniref:Uncharacterized protein n=1 Tax=Blastomyces gilchristii (strain SLH14081) TaxID=559298 RepID=A0A179V388_BLAGS|nr:uncharacterized protein BDBG_17739 [Blastomyces gilchristii SLH14081]OAT13072.1 hypothetical protein BDBG_17739 [Blastomyces gilchristii SLH14081]